MILGIPTKQPVSDLFKMELTKPVQNKSTHALEHGVGVRDVYMYIVRITIADTVLQTPYLSLSPMLYRIVSNVRRHTVLEICHKNLDHWTLAHQWVWYLVLTAILPKQAETTFEKQNFGALWHSIKNQCFISWFWKTMVCFSSYDRRLANFFFFKSLFFSSSCQQCDDDSAMKETKNKKI